jgi:sugar phosphate isomerase/epimerase
MAPMTQLSIKRLASGGVITNYHCVSRCAHCLYNCSPRRAKDYLGEEMAGGIFRLIASLGCRAVHIGGGEPLLAPQKLTAVLAAARRAGVAIDYIETNSAWFADPDQADHLLNQLSEAGVETLLVSISPFHNAHIPFARVKGVIEACRRSGIRAFPWVNAFVRDLDRLDDRETHSMETFEALFGPDYLERIPDRYWIHLGGRALNTFRRVFPQMPAGRILDRAPTSCARALGDTSHFHIDLYGNYIPGLCAGLAVAMEDLGRPLPEGKYALLDRLAANGIRGLHQLAVRRFGYAAQQKTFLNPCDLCTDIRGFLFGLEEEKFPELAPAGFYDEWR